MQKQIATCLLASMLTMVLGPSLTMADATSTDATSTAVSTVLTPQLGGTSLDPISVLAKWEMSGPCFDANGDYAACSEVGGEGLDDDCDDGAQFAAPGDWDTTMDYTICAVVHGRDADILNTKYVITEIFYPDVPMHTSGHETCNSTGVANSDGEEIDNPEGGCGAMIEQNFLKKLDQQTGKNLVCNSLWMGENSNLINTWAEDMDYEALCNTTDGELVKGKAAVYCVDKDLIWEDPAGDYSVDVWAIDENDNMSEIMNNTYTYLETKGFELDFDGVDFGQVRVSDHKRIFGDKCFGTGAETVRNLGNVRLAMKIAQDDMSLGHQTDSSEWNVEYDARVGDLDSDWAYYGPFGPVGEEPDALSDYTVLSEILDLSEIEEMDFSIHIVEKWPQLGSHATYGGSMWIGADTAEFESCGTQI
jgi:hypothetical protein